MSTGTRIVSGDLGDDERLHVALMRALRSDGGSPEGAIALMGRVATEQTWRHLSRRRGGRRPAEFTSFTEYVAAPLSQGGLGMPTDDVKALLKVKTELERRVGTSDRDRELAAYRETIRTALATEIPVAEPRGRPVKGKPCATGFYTNENASSILARLKRDDPDLAAKVVGGEITANAAARQKGWRPPRIELRDPTVVAARIRKHFSHDQIDRLIAALRT